MAVNEVYTHYCFVYENRVGEMLIEYNLISDRIIPHKVQDAAKKFT